MGVHNLLEFCCQGFWLDRHVNNKKKGISFFTEKDRWLFCLPVGYN
jgi:hypothetical protein